MRRSVVGRRDLDMGDPRTNVGEPRDPRADPRETLPMKSAVHFTKRPANGVSLRPHLLKPSSGAAHPPRAPSVRMMTKMMGTRMRLVSGIRPGMKGWKR